MKKIALNYIYLSRKHAGGKDQVGLNFLRGFYQNGASSQMMVFCYDYSVDIIKKIAPDIEIYQIKSYKTSNEFLRLLHQTYTNTFFLYRFVKRERIECIFHLALNNGIRKLPCRTVLLPHDIKQVAHRKISSIKIPMYKYLCYKVMYYLDFKHADKIIAISDFDRAEMDRYYPEYSKKIVRIYNPITIQKMTKVKPMVNYPYIVAVNLQFLHKNIITLIKAYEKIQNKIKHKLVLVGSVPKRVNFLKQYVREHHLENRIVFTGFVEEKDLYRWIVYADLYVNPTLYEGFGMTSVEAIVLGVPTLISKIPVNYEVTKGLCNYYEPADSVEQLAEKILTCLAEKRNIYDLQEKGLIISKAYNYRIISEQYRELLCCMDEEKDENIR